MNPYTVRQTPCNTTLVKFNEVGGGWEQWVLWSADRHWDHPLSDQGLQRRHLEQARERKALVIDIGDLFCAMQGRYDPRASRADVRPEHQTDSYLDSLVSTAAAFFAPYATNVLQLSPGNHESKILKHQETNLTQRLIDALNAAGGNVVMGGFSGWVKFQFVQGDRRGLPAVNAFFHHGYGGGGPVTKGVIQTNRMAVYLPDAHAVISGHTHEEWVLTLPRHRITDQGFSYIDEQTHVRIPTYKEEYQHGRGGWHVERGSPPKPIGAVWQRLWYQDRRVWFEFTRAK